MEAKRKRRERGRACWEAAEALEPATTAGSSWGAAASVWAAEEGARAAAGAASGLPI
jgi:hypothetical protein